MENLRKMICIQTDRQTGGRAEWHDTLLLLIMMRERERGREGLNEGEERESEKEEEPARQGELINLFLFP